MGLWLGEKGASEGGVEAPRGCGKAGRLRLCPGAGMGVGPSPAAAPGAALACRAVCAALTFPERREERDPGQVPAAEGGLGTRGDVPGSFGEFLTFKS